MDFSVFSDENFDVKEWINSALLSEDASKNKEAYAGTLVMKLQLFIQEINNSLEETGHHVLQSVPRILRDVEAIQQESILLRDQMQTVKEKIKKVEHDTAQSMQTLVKIDLVKNRMIDTNQALQEADNWTNLSSDVEAVLGSGDINKISEKLIGMQQSLEILTDVPDYEERCHHLEKLKDKLEALVSPQLIAAFNSHSNDLAQVYAAIFKDIKRTDQFWKYYHQCFKAQLLEDWKKIVSSDQDETVLDWLNAFYDKLISTWHSQIRWCEQAVVTCCPIQVMTSLFADVLKNLDPAIGFCIKAAVKDHSPSATLYTLCDLKQISDRFIKSLQTLIMSSDQDSALMKHVREFVQTVYEPYKEHISKFGDFEEKILMEHLGVLQLVREDTLESVQYFHDSISKVITYVNEACEHCKRLTVGCSYVGLISALTKFFQEYAKKVHRIVNQLKAHCESIINNDDWSIFQQTLRATQSCGELLNKVENIEQDLVSSILESGRHSTVAEDDAILSRRNSIGSNPFTDYKQLLLNKQSQQSMVSLIQQVQQDTNCSVLPEAITSIQHLCQAFCKLLFSIMFGPINKQLSGITSMQLWNEKKSGSALTEDLPTFSLSPQEYITQIGQHLITLPQHIEPFVVDDNPALQLALKNSKLPYMMEQHACHLTDVLLGSVAQGTSQTYCDTIIRIQNLTPTAVKQLVTDIEYLCNVLDDLGLKPGDNDSLQIVLSLLSVSRDQYAVVSHGKPAHLVNAIRRMRDF